MILQRQFGIFLLCKCFNFFSRLGAAESSSGVVEGDKSEWSVGADSRIKYWNHRHHHYHLQQHHSHHHHRRYHHYQIRVNGVIPE